MAKPSDYIRKGWCKNTNALDDNGYSCEPTAPYAVKWCLAGAVCAAYKDDTPKREHAFDKVLAAIAPQSLFVAYWNDQPKRTKEEVIALLESIGEQLYDYIK